MTLTVWDSLVRHGETSGALGGIRTPDTWFRRPVLYPLSYERVGSVFRARPLL
jgi:hypothetical protein